MASWRRSPTAAYRIVTIPPPVVADVKPHLERFAATGADGFVFIGPSGGPLRRATLYKAWRGALASAGIDKPLRPHDLRPTGNTVAATGASTKELTARMGHSSAQAALLYPHATRNRDQAIATARRLMMGAGPAPKASVLPLVPRAVSEQDAG